MCPVAGAVPGGADGAVRAEPAGQRPHLHPGAAPLRGGPPPGGRGPAAAAAQRGLRPRQTDFYPYRYFASEGFLPGYSFPRLPLAAFIPGAAPAAVAMRRLPATAPVPGDQRVRPRRADLPRGRPLRGHPHPAAPRSAADRPGRSTPPTAQRCQACGYHHDGGGPARRLPALRRPAGHRRRTGCCSCGPCSPAAASGSPATRRNAAGRASSWRSPTAFADRGDRPGSTSATATNRRRPRRCWTSPTATRPRCGSPTSGDAGARTPATAASGSTPSTAAGCRDKQAPNATADPTSSTTPGQATFKTKVIPYVEDTRNILITRLPHTARPEPWWPPCSTPWSAASRPRSSWRTPS